MTPAVHFFDAKAWNYLLFLVVDFNINVSLVDSFQ